MTLNELYISSVSKLEKIDNSSTEARIILKKAMSFTETDFLLNKNRILTDEEVTTAESMINRRLSGVPVQYIIGEWDFFGKTFKVNENVLIPRPETELLCEYVIDYLKDKSSPVVADLCAGSGCIGITVKDNIASACVYMVEKSSEAYKVCCENAESILGDKSTTVINEDIFCIDKLGDLPLFDVIISNPPYIKSAEIPDLQSEVLLEPEMALDGGEDGLDFYRLIAEKWTDYLADDGMFAFECGEEQAEEIKVILEKKNFSVIFVKDYSDVDRFVIGKRRKI